MILALSGLRGQGITLGWPGDTADVFYSLMNRGPCWKLSPVCLKGPRFYPLFLPKETLPKTAGNHPLDSFFQMIFYLHIVCTETNLYIQFSNKNYQLEVMKKKIKIGFHQTTSTTASVGLKKSVHFEDFFILLENRRFTPAWWQSESLTPVRGSSGLILPVVSYLYLGFGGGSNYWQLNIRG